MSSSTPAASAARRFRFADLGLRAKIMSLVALSVVVSLVGVGVAAVALGSTSRQTRDLMNSDVDLTVTAVSTRVSTATFRRAVLQLILANTNEETAAATKDLDAATSTAAANIAKMAGAAGADPADTAKIAQVQQAWTAMHDFFTAKIEPLAKQENLSAEQVDTLSGLATGEFTTLGDATAAALQAFIDEKRADMTSKGDDVASAAGFAQAEAIGIGVVGGLVLALFGWWIAGAVARPVARVKTAVDALADGDLTRTVQVDSRDEVGRMAEALTRAQAALRESMTTIVTSSATLAGSAEELSAVSAQVAASAEETSVQSGSAAAAAEQVSRNVQTVASATEQMSASIMEISQSSTEAVRVAQAAAAEAQTATGTVAKLGDSSREIGDVVKVITSIAEQTNLLALNATIEAARAGEAGKGFAVVASEVKDLAQETARATEDISRRIEAIQSDSEEAVAAIARIAEIIEEVNSYQSTIAAAVEEQTATTGEMSRSVQEAAAGAGGIAGNIEYVATAAQSSSTGIVEAQRAAAELAQLSGDLRELVSRFTV